MLPAVGIQLNADGVPVNDADEWDFVFLFNFSGGIGTVLAAAGAGPIADKWGRKIMLVMTSVTCILGTGSQLFMWDFWSGNVTRGLAGIPIGLAAVICPLYLGEMAPPKIRGSIGTLFNISIGIGLTVAAVVGHFFLQIFRVTSWKYMFAIGMLPGAFLLVTSVIAPESTMWIEEKKRKEIRNDF